MNNNKLLKYNINYYILILLIFTLPFKSGYLPIILVLWIFTWLLEGNLKTKFLEFNYKNKLFIAFAIYFFILIIQLIQAKNIYEGLKFIQHSLSILFLPIIIGGSNKKIKKFINIILLAFVIASLIASVYLLAYALFSNIIVENNQWYIKYWIWDGMDKFSFFSLVNMRANVFSYGFLSFLIHPSYLSMYILFSIIILINFLRQKFIQKIFYKIITGIIIIFFTIMIYLLQSKAGLLTFFTTVFFIILIEIYRKKQKRYFFTGIVVLVIGAIFILSSTRMQKIIKQSKILLEEPQKVELSKMDARFQTNFATIQIIKENFCFGVGPANMYNELEKQYKKYGFEKAAKERLNAHNQYLETFAGLGVFGFLTLMYIFIGGIIYAYKHKHYLLFFLILILMINFFFESMLNRINGVLFMMLFYSLFVFMKPENEPEAIKKT